MSTKHFSDLLETAWGIIANAGGGDWEKETPEWQEAAKKWRDDYFETTTQGESEKEGK